jgi:hypothetical protein
VPAIVLGESLTEPEPALFNYVLLALLEPVSPAGPDTPATGTPPGVMINRARS